MKSFTTLKSNYKKFSQNSSTENETLGAQMINDAHKYLLQQYFFNEATTTIVTVAQQQAYALPYNYSKLKTGTITIGNLKWTPTEILTRQEWDNLNVFPYYSDIPSNYFIYNNKFEIFPIPSTAGNTITFNYKTRVPELKFEDYITGTVEATNGSAIIKGTLTSWLANYLPAAGSVLNLNLWIQITSPKGDGEWYKISSIEDATNLTLVNNYAGLDCTGASFVIGQMPLLLEDYHDLCVYRPLEIYFSSINQNETKLAQFSGLYKAGIGTLDEYAGSKTVNVNLKTVVSTINPNLYNQNFG